jgi:hypothetical protein
MKTNESKIAFFSFHLLFRIGTFQWVTADSNKKNPFPCHTVAQISQIAFLSPALAAGRRVIHIRSAEIRLARIQFFRKKMSKNFMGGPRFLREAGLCAAQSDADGAPLAPIQSHFRGKLVKKLSNGPFTSLRDPLLRGLLRT